jgi:RNA polymerase sigma-70 factor, ECF subfamily
MSAALATPFTRKPEPAARIRSLHTADAMSDDTLVTRARSGERWAEEAIYRRYVGYLAGLALRLLRNRSEAEDVVQDTFVLALEQIGALREGGALRGWLSQIAVSQVRRRLRRRRLLRVLGLDRTVEDATLELLARDGLDGEARAELATLDRVLATLHEEERIAWLLRRAEGATLEEVAIACACSLATAKRRIASADARVRLHVTLKEVGS